MPGPKLNDQILNNEQEYDARQADADKNDRLWHHYLALEGAEDKLELILDGAFDKTATGESIEGTDTKRVVRYGIDVFTPSEKKAFMKCSADFFNPYKADGSPDFDEFEKNMDAYAKKMATLRVEQGLFINSTDFSSMDIYQSDVESKREASYDIYPPAIQRKALISLFQDKNGSIDDRFIYDYCDRKARQFHLDVDDFSEYEHDALREALEEVEEREASNIHPKWKEAFEVAGDNEDDAIVSIGSAAEKEKIIPIAGIAKADVAEAVRANKVWLYPEDNISIDALQKLDNLYAQHKDADHWYHRDSKEYRQFKAALKEAHDKYEECKLFGRELTEAEKKELVPLFDKVASSADKYLSGKELKDRKSKLGQERYDIAFSALHVTSHGRAKEKMRDHNFYRALRGSKEISVKDLEDRAGRSSVQKREYKKSAKAASKDKAINRNFTR